MTGAGRISMRPDLASLRLGVAVTAETARAAREESATVMQRVIGALEALGIAERDLRTSIVSVSPAYDYSASTNPPRVTGYTFTNLVAAVIRDVSQVGEAIDAALTAGATNVDQLAFRVDDAADAERRARVAAVEDARSKADQLAASAGVSITGIASIVEVGAAVPYPMPLAEMAALKARDASTPVEAGEHDISVGVVVSYLIG